MESSTAVTQLSALAQDSRLAIYRLLVAKGAQGLAAGDIAARLDLPAPTLSFHLAQLKQAGLVTCRRESRSLIYSADYAAMNTLLGFLTENCCGVQAELCAPAAEACDDATCAAPRRAQTARRA